MIKHIGFIMDGNRRFAKKNNISLKQAYRQGMEQFLNVIDFQIKKNIKHTSFFALSSQNYEKRKKEELKPIFELVEEFFEKNEIEEFFIKNNIKVTIRGNKKELEKRKLEFNNHYRKFLTKLEKKLEEFNEKITQPDYFVHIALNYDGQQELVEAFEKLQKENKKSITIEDIKKNLYFNDVPPPEVIVRPGNAPRISGFLLFDSAYSEMYLTPKLWPELKFEDLEEIINWFSTTQRNFGK